MTQKTPPRRRRSGWTRWLPLFLFVVMPLVEIWALIQVGQVIGPWWTIAILLADSILGAWLLRHEGRRAWKAFGEAAQTGRIPSREVADGALVIVGATLLLTPGFVTDFVGFFFLLPFTRPIARGVLTRLIAPRLTAVWLTTARTPAAGGASAWGGAPGPVPHPGSPPASPPRHIVIPGEVVHDHDPPERS